MRLEPPAWWYRAAPDMTARALQPLGMLYGLAARIRMRSARGYRSKLPVICIGNPTAGGAGKTPTAIEVARLLVARGEKPVFLTRGFGGSKPGPHQVDPAQDTAAEVGDEALVLVRHAPVIVARDRLAGAKAIEATAATVIVMDDGFQNPSLVKDVSILVVDAARGVGNGLCMPAGPLRLPLDWQLAHADGVLILGKPAGRDLLDPTFPRGFPGLVLHGQVTPAGSTRWLQDTPIVAFAGIGRPEKLFETLEAAGAKLVARRPFPDHHIYNDAEALGLIAEARAADAILVTTEKDHARLARAGRVGELAREAHALPVRLTLPEADLAKLENLINLALRERRGTEDP